MPYIFVEELEEGQEAAEVVDKSEYDTLDSLYQEAQNQRDAAIERAVNAESDYSKMRQKYADTFLKTPSKIQKQTPESILPQSIDELFE